MEIFGVDLAVIAPLLIIELILVVVALVDWFKIEKTNGPKWMWLLIILFINLIGPILYFVVGRRQD
ncbi:PLDc N-terminal domain-containing protein [Sediminibacillus massiliensis]|uniref:PLDc N-terminal domain-containing protein n=1 Tax=Sediminibacillus massiliensis TaxID=1926277 RepID=UPI00098878C9|nr:PLDc N-terminal domain-containing protein [Sediminibacillus massiliensis]